MNSWLITIKPFDSESKNKLEVFNESIVLLLAYFGFLFTNYVDKPTSKHIFGYVYLAVLGFGLMVNISVMAFYTIRDFIIKRRALKNKKIV